MAFDPNKYGLTLEISGDNLENARSAYVTLVEQVKASSETTQDQEKKLREQYASSPADISEIREQVWNLLQENPEVSVSLFEEIGNLKSDVKTFRDVFISEEARQGKIKFEVPTDLVERKSEAESLGEFIRSLYKAASAMSVDLGEFPTKKLEKSGEVVPDLPRLPSGPRDAESSGGRGAQTRQLRFSVNGEEVPQGTTLRQVLISVSDAHHIFSVSWLQDEIKRTEQDMFSELWEVKLPNGHVLAGWLPDKK